MQVEHAVVNQHLAGLEVIIRGDVSFLVQASAIVSNAQNGVRRIWNHMTRRISQMRDMLSPTIHNSDSDWQDDSALTFPSFSKLSFSSESLGSASQTCTTRSTSTNENPASQQLENSPPGMGQKYGNYLLGTHGDGANVFASKWTAVGGIDATLLGELLHDRQLRLSLGATDERIQAAFITCCVLIHMVLPRVGYSPHAVRFLFENWPSLARPEGAVARHLIGF